MTAEVKVEEKQVEAEVVVPPQEETVKVVEEDVKETIETETVQEETKPQVLEKSVSFKEESNFFSDLKESERKALSDLKSKLEEAIVGNTLFKKKKKKEKKEGEDEKKTAAIVTEEEKKTAAIVTEETPKEEETEDVKKAAAIVTDETLKEEETEDVKKAEDAVTDETLKEEVKAETEEEKKGEDVVAEETLKEEAKAETEEEEEEEEETVDQEITLWGVPLLPSKGGEATDVILLKFLRARDLKVNEAFEMLKKTLKWRKKHNIDSILNEDFGEELNSSAAYMNGIAHEGQPVCYNIYDMFDNEELYKKTFGTEENRERFLRWRIQLMEKGIKKLDLKPGGVTSLLQIHDLKNSPGLARKELRVVIKHIIEALQDNYPELVSRNIFINVPFWFYALNAVLSLFLTQRTRSKFVVARPAKVTETLLKYIPAEEIPVQYGGFKRDDDLEFSDAIISEAIVKPGSSETIEIPAPEVGATVIWEITVVGWEVNYKEEFIPADEGSYTVIVQKGKKIGSNDGPIRNNFRNNETGKIVLTVDNVSGKKKRVLYRYKTKIGSSF